LPARFEAFGLAFDPVRGAEMIGRVCNIFRAQLETNTGYRGRPAGPFFQMLVGSELPRLRPAREVARR
jgi:hypothetical protein